MADLEATLATWVASGKLKGATAAVVTADGVWSSAAGVDGAGHRLDPDSAQWIASVTKTFTAAEVMLLSARGLVDLDAPVTDYVDLPFDAGGATVRQVLSMRSGFPVYPDGRYFKVISANRDRTWTAAQVLASIPEDAARGGALGGMPYYNNINYVVLGELVRVATGTGYAEAIRSDLLKSAGLERTWVQAAETPLPPLTVGTEPGAAGLVQPGGPCLPSCAVATFGGGGASIAGDAADLARWGYFLYGGRILEPALVQELQADAQPDQTGVPYALGTQVLTDNGNETFLGHAGGGTDWPYTANLSVWIGDHPVAIAVISPEPADFGTAFWDLIMHFHQTAAQS